MNKEFVCKVKIFDTLDEAETAAIISLIKTKTYKKGETVFKEGDTNTSLYIIEEGKVKIINEITRTEFKTLATLTKYDAFGELALFDKAPRSASVIASETTVIGIIEGQTFEKLLSSNSKMASKIYKEIIIEIAVRLRAGNEKLQDNITWGMIAKL
ncbi:MAG: hypothetical protein A2452_07870 [Candidatus Firestonebacteria bacterium RIFOXYC2_FULL_39_67]|nr:MAG: hypothetical protein A2536_08195 [Candidatus Firestonebacteria bacterium RIFOXYD2_FULL_39_29]OGF54475.1 MAG: hypothetical protein A2497_07395 [Candidatus Firestonebacteria bacterium RifOxyC12_full_39_7]OGF56759.1 MAG: hypothetical protein A2452_07870 [Candidatus Firestonebacteria bacterium RIFOXYC2_FULL_39_67]